MIQLIDQPEATMHLKQWKNQIPRYENLVQKCLKQISRQLDYILPTDFDTRIHNLKQLLQTGGESETDHLDIVLYYIDGQKNKTIIQVANRLSSVLGKQFAYWSSKIVDYAIYEKYGENYHQWEVKKQYNEYLHLAPDALGNIRRFRRLAKSYIEVLLKLIKIIRKTEKVDEIPKIDEAFKKVKNAQLKYYAFIEQVEIAVEDEAGQLSNHSIIAKNNAKKTLFNFVKVDTKTTVQYNTLPLTNYRFSINKEKAQRPSSKICPKLEGTELKDFQFIVHNLEKPEFSVSYLREKFCHEHVRKSQKFKKSKQIFTSIFDKCYFFSYNLYPVDMQRAEQVDFTKPFTEYQFANYEVNSEEEFNDILGEDVEESCSESSSDNSNYSGKSFIVKDGFLSDDSDNQNLQSIKATIEPKSRWIFSPKQIPNNCIDLSHYEAIFPFPKTVKSLPLSLNDPEEDIIKKELLVHIHNKNKKSIMKVVREGNYGVSKAKVQIYLKQSCKQIRVGRKLIYQVTGYGYGSDQGSDNSVESVKQQISKQKSKAKVFPDIVITSPDGKRKTPHKFKQFSGISRQEIDMNLNQTAQNLELSYEKSENSNENSNEKSFEKSFEQSFEQSKGKAKKSGKGKPKSSNKRQSPSGFCREKTFFVTNQTSEIKQCNQERACGTIRGKNRRFVCPNCHDKMKALGIAHRQYMDID